MCTQMCIGPALRQRHSARHYSRASHSKPQSSRMQTNPFASVFSLELAAPREPTPLDARSSAPQHPKQTDTSTPLSPPASRAAPPQLSYPVYVQLSTCSQRAPGSSPYLPATCVRHDSSNPQGHAQQREPLLHGGLGQHGHEAGRRRSHRCAWQLQAGGAAHTDATFAARHAHFCRRAPYGGTAAVAAAAVMSIAVALACAVILALLTAQWPLAHARSPWTFVDILFSTPALLTSPQLVSV